MITVISLTLAGARAVLASCGDDGTIRLWDPVTATPVGMPMKGHTSTIEDICGLPAPDGRTLLAGAGDDGTVRLWDPATGQPVGPAHHRACRARLELVHGARPLSQDSRSW